MTTLPAPRDPVCGRLAADMDHLDSYWAEGAENLATYTEAERQAERAAYARTDGTYNRRNGHFWCDDCYIRAGTPLGTCP